MSKALFKSSQAFTRLDMLVIIVVICGVAAAWFWVTHTGDLGRVVRCRQNLKMLGQAMNSFANDHVTGLPPAGIEEPELSWDGLIMPYLSQSTRTLGPSPGKTQGVPDNRDIRVSPKVADGLLRCPADTLNREFPRTYAMPEHDQKRENWPPGPLNSTGVGLLWAKQDAIRQMGNKTFGATAQDITKLSLVKLSWLPAPADTILLAEWADFGNQIGSLSHAAIDGAGSQIESLRSNWGKFHRGRFNYLMVDGHVELISPLQTGSIDGYDMEGPRGIWIIKPEN